MKKIFVVLCATIMSLVAFADGKTCKVSGTAGTVEVNAYQDGTIIIVDFGNDTDVDVNINFTVRYVINNSTAYSESRTKRVPPHSSSSMKINTTAKEDQKITNVQVTSLSGRKCEN